jgi:hypothetical protein
MILYHLILTSRQVGTQTTDILLVGPLLFLQD